MKFNTSSIDFSAALQTVSMAVAARNVVSALECILVEAGDDDVVALTGSDGNTRITVRLSCSVQEPGAALLRAKTFEEITRKFPHCDIAVSTDSGGNVTIKGGRVKTRLSSMVPDQYPAHEPAELTSSLTLPASRFCALIASVEDCIATDEARPILTGGCLDAHDGSVTMVGLDGFRLGLRTVSDPASTLEEDAKVIVPAHSLRMLKKLLSRAGDEPITLNFGEKELSVIYGGAEFSCRLIEGEFIAYRKIIPGKFATRVQVNALNMRAAVDRLITLAANSGKNGKLMKLSISEENGFVLHGVSSDSDITEDVDADIHGKSLEISFNALYFMDALKQFDEGDIVISFNTWVSPCIISYADSADIDADEFFWLILPVRAA